VNRPSMLRCGKFGFDPKQSLAADGTAFAEGIDSV
jgi:hypothetical protein